MFCLLKCEFSEDERGGEYINTVRCQTYQLWKAINQGEEKKQWGVALKKMMQKRGSEG